MSDDFRQRVVTTEQGQQIFIRDTEMISVNIEMSADATVSEKPIDEFTISELQEIINGSTKNNIRSATIKTISGSYKESKATEQMQTKTQITGKSEPKL